MAASLIAAKFLICAWFATISSRALAKGVDAERFIDPSLLRELERSGFFAIPSGGK